MQSHNDSDSDSARRQSQVPATLMEAHEVLWRQRPTRDADPLRWVEFHRHSAKVYAQTAEVDIAHQSEARAHAGMEIRKAREIEHRLTPEDDE